LNVLALREAIRCAQPPHGRVFDAALLLKKFKFSGVQAAAPEALMVEIFTLSVTVLAGALPVKVPV
jgi:hypothetical protein